jgi:hypothetical protein
MAAQAAGGKERDGAFIKLGYSVVHKASYF